MRFSSSNLSTPNPFDPLTDAFHHRKSNHNASSFVAHASGCADTPTSVHGRMGAVAEFHHIACLLNRMCLPLPITLLPTFVHDCLRHFVLQISRRLGGTIFNRKL
jgi:hypothetical protein